MLIKYLVYMECHNFAWHCLRCYSLSLHKTLVLSLGRVLQPKQEVSMPKARLKHISPRSLRSNQLPTYLGQLLHMYDEVFVGYIQCSLCYVTFHCNHVKTLYWWQILTVGTRLCSGQHNHVKALYWWQIFTVGTRLCSGHQPNYLSDNVRSLSLL